MVAYKTNTSYNPPRGYDKPSSSSDYSNVQNAAIPAPQPVPQEPVTMIWAGKTYTIEQPPPEPPVRNVEMVKKESTILPFIPRQLKRPSSSVAKNDSLDISTSAIRAKLNKVSEPQLEVNIKRKKRS